MLQGTCVLKASIIGVICNVTWSVVKKLKLPTRPQFLLNAVMWLCIPMISLSLSITFKTGQVWCTTTADNEAIIAYGLTFLFPIVVCVILDFALYFQMQNSLSKFKSDMGAHRASNTHSVKLMAVVQKLKYFPLAFGLSWVLEILLVLLYLSGCEREWFVVLDLLAAIGICSTGLSIAAIYFYHQKSHSLILDNIISIWRRLVGCVRHRGAHRHPSMLDDSFVSSSALSRTSATCGDKSRHDAIGCQKSSQPSAAMDISTVANVSEEHQLLDGMDLDIVE